MAGFEDLDNDTLILILDYVSTSKLALIGHQHEAVGT